MEKRENKIETSRVGGERFRMKMVKRG